MSSNNPLSAGKTLKERIARDLENTIKTRMSPGDKLLPEVDLARELKVSRGTVRNALDLLEEEGLITRQKKVGTVVTARAAARSVAFFFSGPDAVLTGSDYATPVVEGLSSEAGRSRTNLMFLYSATKIGRTRAEHVAMIPWSKVDGAIVFEDFSDDFLAALRPYKSRVVVADNDKSRIGLTSVVYDNREAGRLAARELLKAGHTKVGWFGELTDHGNGVDPSYIERFEGFTSELARNGITLAKECVFDVPRPGQEEEEIARRAAALAAEGQLTGGYCIMPRTADAIRGAVREAEGVVPPACITMHSFARTAPAKLPYPRIGFDGYALGIACMETINALLDGRETPGRVRSIAPVLIPGKKPL